MKHSTTKFRRVMALTLALLLVVGLTGCIGQKDPDPTDAPTEVVTEAPTEKPTEKPTEAPTEKPTEAPEKGVMGTVSANNLNVRSNHASDSAILSQLPVNLRVEILEQKTVGGTNWGRIGEMTLPNGTKIDGGWLNLHYVKLDAAEDDKTGTATEPSSGNTTPVDPDEEALGTITAQQLQIRKGAGTTYDTAGSYKKGDRVKVLEQKTVSGTTWGRTEKGWISMSYVKLDGSAGSATDTGTNIAQPGATTPTTPGSSSSGTGTGTGTASVEVSNNKTTILGYVVVDTDGLTLRTGPGTKYKSLGTAKEGDRYPYYQTSNKWYRTSHGWLSNADDAYLYIEGDTADDAAMATILAKEMHVRQGPGTNFKSVTTLKKGEKLVVLGQADGWGYTRLGWINVDKEYVSLDDKITYVTGEAEVLVDDLNVRKEADADSKRLAGLDKGDDIEILELDDNWGKIEYATDKEGWINLSYVKMTSASSDSDSDSDSSSSSSTTKYDVTIGELTNGAGCEIVPSTKYCAKGTKVTLYIKTATGLKLKDLIVKDANGTKVEVTDNTFTMPASNVTVTAEFIDESAVEYKVTIGKITGKGKVAIKGDTDKFTAGTTVELDVEPDTGYDLDKVYYNGTEVTGDSFEMPVGNVTVTATFTAIKYDVNLIGDGNGTVKANKVEATFGESIKLTIKPNDGYVLDKIELDAEYDVAISDKTFKMPPCAVNVYVTFKEK